MSACQSSSFWRQSLSLVQYVADKAIAADDAEHKAKAESRKVAKLEETWLSCLNNKGLWINDRLHICSVADTHIRQSEKEMVMDAWNNPAVSDEECLSI